MSSYIHQRSHLSLSLSLSLSLKSIRGRLRFGYEKCNCKKKLNEMREEEEERGKREMKLMVAWCVLGLASWVQTNGIFQELPEIAKHAPGRCITTLYIRAKKKKHDVKTHEHAPYRGI
jgi:hypothetical protein